MAIISRHAVSNYGSLLQAYALQVTMEKLGVHAFHIDYFSAEEKPKSLCEIMLRQSDWNRDFIHRLVFYMVHLPNQQKMCRAFQRMREQYLHLSEKKYAHLDELEQWYPKADIYCTGSDQVWNTILLNKIDPAYFLSFVPKQKNKISYAASFGRGYIDSENREKIAKWLSEYDQVSVRESAGLKILEDLQLHGTQVLDPTFLLSSTEWRKLIRSKDVLTCKYILVYQIHRNDALIQYARDYGKFMGYKVINISVSYTQKKRGMTFAYLPSISRLLALFDHAHCIITDSFHATAFSINLNKRFMTMLPNVSTSRNRSVLDLFGLKSRVITDEHDFKLAEQEIQYDTVNQILEAERIRSTAWLKEALKQGWRK